MVRPEPNSRLVAQTRACQGDAWLGRCDCRALGNLATVLSFAFLLLTGRGLAAAADNPEAGFLFHGKPVHPLLIKQFEPWISDARPPITVEVNLTAAWDSNEYAAGFKTDSNLMVSVSLPEGASYAYQHLGKMRNGMHVLRTFDAEGGSGVFEALLFVRFRTRVAYLGDGVKQGEQIFLEVVRRYPLGDRDGAEVQVKPERVIVGKSRFRDKPVELRFGKDEPMPVKQ